MGGSGAWFLARLFSLTLKTCSTPDLCTLSGTELRTANTALSLTVGGVEGERRGAAKGTNFP